MNEAAGPCCVVCRASSCEEIIFIPDMPVQCNRLFATADEARAAVRGDIRLVECRACGHIFNAAFDPELLGYDEGYENALHFSPRVRDYLESIVSRLTERYGLEGKEALELGCGDGHFLQLLSRRAGMICIGYDPSQPDSPRRSVGTGSVELRGRPLADAEAAQADFVCARHVIEHLPEPVEFVEASLRRVRRPGGVAYFEVPDARMILRDGGIWDIIYEHVSHFVPSSLVQAVRLAGGGVADLGVDFGGQYLWSEAAPGNVTTKSCPANQHSARQPSDDQFAKSVADTVERWRCCVDRILASGRRVALWGAGSKGVTFPNMLEIAAREGFDTIVDINPRKTGRFIPGTAHRVIAPDELRDYRPDVVIVMNREYIGEIGATLRRLDIDSEIIVA